MVRISILQGQMSLNHYILHVASLCTILCPNQDLHSPDKMLANPESPQGKHTQATMRVNDWPKQAQSHTKLL